jgi:hypothetical protein
MALLCRPTTIADEEQLTEFLTRVFADNAGLVSSEMLIWKYWTPRADCAEPRSLVMERDGRILAHVGLWPVTVRVETDIESGVHAMDWAADPHAMGAGWSVFMSLTKNHDFVYGIGGEGITRSILPKLGFRTVAETQTWARPIRPLQQMLQHQSKDVRLPLRFARNSWWSAMPRRSIPRGWSAVEHELSEAGAPAGIAVLRGERDESFFRYLRQCPLAPCHSFNLVNDGRIVGFFALSVAGEQARVAGVWLENPSPENWRIAFQLAQDAALRHTNASEIVARCSAGESFLGAEQAGLRLRARMPVLLFRKDGNTELVPPLQFQLCDSDALFLRGRLAMFLT